MGLSSKLWPPSSSAINKYASEVPNTLSLASVLPGNQSSIISQIWYREYLFVWTISQRESETAREQLIFRDFGPSVKIILNTVNSRNCKSGGGFREIN